MERLAAIRFNNVGKYYYFSTDLDLHKGDKVVVETVRGLELGELITELKDMSEFNLDTELKRVIRKANMADIDVHAFNLAKAETSFDICKDIIAETDLDMQLISCEYTLDASKVIFMYTADGRVDFRELLKKLAAEFKCRIELRQVGPRDKAKIVGGIGVCGLQLCCNSFLGEFEGVSINMAKNQLLAINIEKISGNCGRLLCCLKYEDEAYTDLKKKYPKIGSTVTYEGKKVKVVGLNVINELVKIDDEGNILFISLDEALGKKKEEPGEEKPKEKKEKKQRPQRQQNQQKTQNKPQNRNKPQNKQAKQNKPNNRNSKKRYHKKGNNKRGQGQRSH